MSIEDQHVALPKLYGAPAYARPPAIATPVTPRPFDLDELPIEAYQTDDEREVSAKMPTRRYGSTGLGQGRGSTTSTGLQPRSFNLRGIAGRILGGS